MDNRGSLWRVWLRRFLAWTLALILLVLPLRAFALRYSDDENLLTVDVPENDSTLCYTGEKARLPEEMQSLAERSGLEARLLVRSYTPEELLGYTLDVVVCPLSSLEEAVSPAPAGASVRADRYTDITVSGVEEQALDLVREMYGGRFHLGAARSGSFQGVPDLELSGTGDSASHWADYECSVYLLTNSERLVIIAAAYLPSQAEAVRTFLAGISLDGSPALTEPPGASIPEPSETAAPAFSGLPAAAVQTESAPPAASGQAWTAAAREFLNRHPNLPYYALLAAAAFVLAVGLIINLRAARERQWTLEDDGDALMPARSARRSRRNRHAIKEENMGVSERSFRTGRPEYDYAEDISRYTQQPSADVNDVSRYTHGYEEADSLSDELSKALQDEPQAPPVRIQTVGSRVERNRRKKRR